MGKSLAFAVIVAVAVLSSIPGSYAMINGLYCGKENCYELLGVTRDTSKAEISKAYRQLAKKYHPDRHKADEKSEASERFKEVATAYEILKDEESRSDYDYMLDHPEEFYNNYYRYYKRTMSPKIDVRIVIIVTITVISIFQYYTAMFRWKSGMRYLTSQPKYRTMALNAAEEEGLLNDVKKLKKRNKEEIRAEEERIIRLVLETKMDIKGGYAKPKMVDVLWMQLILFPLSFYRYVMWYLMWMWRFRIKDEEYGTEEKLYLIRKLMGLSQTKFEAIPEDEKEDFLDMKLWIRDNFQEWKKEKEEEMKKQMAESAKYKSYRRYMKKHGSGRMYFDDS